LEVAIERKGSPQFKKKRFKIHRLKGKLKIRLLLKIKIQTAI